MPGFVINEDNSHYFYDRGLRGANVESLKKLAQNYCKGQSVEVIYNLNSMRSSVDGLAFEPIWKDIEDHGDKGMTFRGKELAGGCINWIRGAKALHDAGIDPYKVWLEETRKLGRRASISIRMNDIHCVDDEDSFMHAEFWRSHPEYRREPGDLAHGWNSAALDYSVPEVREYSLRMVLDVLARYDMDGLELDWMRFGHHVRPGYEDVTRAALTEFHVQVRSAVQKREAELGHKISLSIRCPALPQEAFDMGYDVVEWAKTGLIDRVVPTPFFATTDFEIPVAFWRRILPENVPVDAGVELRIQASSEWWGEYIVQSPSTLCALAVNYFAQGADRFYLFNHMDSDTTMPAGYEELFSLVGDPETAAAHERRHVVTYTDTVSCGSPVKSTLPLLCWERCGSGYLRVDVGPAPEAGRTVELIIGLDDGTADLVPVFNGVELTHLRTEDHTPDERRSDRAVKGFSYLRAYPDNVKTLMTFDAAPAVKSGRNTFWFRNKSDKKANIVWAELKIGAQD